MKTFIALLGSAVLLVTAGCGDEPIASYRVAHENAAAAAPAAVSISPVAAAPSSAVPVPMAGTEVQTAAGAALAWTAPANWVVKPPSAMRKGSYTISATAGEADVSITAFPGAVGGELANLNRWRSQLQLPPLGGTDAAASVQRETRNGLEFVIVDLSAAGANPPGILGAMVPVGDTTWFFKASGPAATLAAVKPEFLAFLQTVRPAAP